MIFRELDRKTLVADGQLQATDMVAAAARGVTMIINSRPDGEEAEQPTAAELEAAAAAAGLDYAFIPISAEFSAEKVEAMRAALVGAEGLALLFCRSGTRSAYLWALARAREGALPQALVQNAARAGYNLHPILPWLKPKGLVDVLAAEDAEGEGGQARDPDEEDGERGARRHREGA